MTYDTELLGQHLKVGRRAVLILSRLCVHRLHLFFLSKGMDGYIYIFFFCFFFL